MSRDLSKLAYPVCTLIQEYNFYNRDSVDYVLFNQGLLAGLQRQTVVCDREAYLEGYLLGKNY